jgi:asparagine synthase (glutamine-hydrolysing)
MATAYSHRGPDEESLSVYGRAGFAFRRLSIIDVAGGHQPVDDERRRVHSITNGEIYNHLELRGELEGRGHRFRTGSDAEVVVHGYEEFGDGIVSRLRGMFALAVWDEDRQRLLLARDRMGQKPLVYHEVGGRLTFASELAGVLADPAVPRALDHAAIDEYLTFQYVPAPRTAFRGIRKLPPAHLLVFEDGRARLERYWSLSAQPRLRISSGDATRVFEQKLEEAVRLRLMSDVPLGAFLSGGLDSSAVVALMAEQGPVKTFSIGFEEGAFDELPYAREVARRFATEHHEFVVRPRAIDLVADIARHYGEPFGDASAVPTWYLARLTAAKVKVALNGDGGDELLGGYDRYGLMRAFSALARLPVGRGLAHATSRALAHRLPVRARRLLNAVGVAPEESYARTVSAFDPEQRALLYTEDMRRELGDSDAYAPMMALFAASDAPDLIGRTMGVDLASYLPGDLMVKVDIATMAHGLEGRSPFLDHPLVEFVARLPTALKLRLSGGKWLLRNTMADRLPRSVLRRRKQGFGVPLGQWLRGELRELVTELVLSPSARQREVVRPDAAQRICEEHWSGRRDRSVQIWLLLMLELWFREVLQRPAAGGEGAQVLEVDSPG